MISGPERARLEARRLKLFPTLPATDAGRSSEPPADTGDLFTTGALKGRFRDRFRRIEAEVDPLGLVQLVKEGDPDACAAWEARKADIEWWSEEHAKREAEAAPARRIEQEKATLAKLGIPVPEGEGVQSFFEKHSSEISAMEQARQAREQAAALEAEAEKLTAGVAERMKEETPS